MQTVDVSRAAYDLHHRSARIVRFADLRFSGLPLPDDEVLMVDGLRQVAGRVYAIDYGNETIMIAPD